MTALFLKSTGDPNTGLWCDLCRKAELQTVRFGQFIDVEHHILDVPLLGPFNGAKVTDHDASNVGGASSACRSYCATHSQGANQPGIRMVITGTMSVEKLTTGQDMTHDKTEHVGPGEPTNQDCPGHAINALYP